MKVTKEEYLKHKPGFCTRACHGALESEKNYRDIIPPVSTSTSYKIMDPSKLGQSEYSRSANPSRAILEACLATIEGCKHAVCFASGLGATSTLLFLLNSGDNILCFSEVCDSVQKVFTKCASNMNISTSFIEPTEIESLEEAITPNTKMVWIESPTEPLLNIVDIRRVAGVVQKFTGVILVVDNTWLTPYFQKPLELGADISTYSLSKFMNGHSDVMMGAICTNSDELHRRIQFLQRVLGVMPSPVDCHQMTRSLKTLPLRMDQHMKNGLIVGRYLESHSQVERVIHPGLPSHPHHALLKKQCYGYGGVLAFYLKGGEKESRRFVSGLKLITLAESFGGCESLIEIPALMSHSSLSAEERERLGIPESLIRISVGLEDPEDLIQDIEQALAKPPQSQPIAEASLVQTK